MTPKPTFPPSHPLHPSQSAPVLCSRTSFPHISRAIPPSHLNQKPRVTSTVEAFRGALFRTSMMQESPGRQCTLARLHLCPLTSRTTGTACCCAAFSLRGLDRDFFQIPQIPFLFRFNGKTFALEAMDIGLPTLCGHDPSTRLVQQIHRIVRHLFHSFCPCRGCDGCGFSYVVCVMFNSQQ